MNKQLLIERLIYDCQSKTQSYPSFQNLRTPHATFINNSYQQICYVSNNNEIKTQYYPETSGYNKLVVYIGVCFQIPFKNNKFSVYTKIVFPPNFPMVPPIFSIININAQTFQVNKKYFNNLLPDKSYEVKLLSSYYWIQNFDFKPLLNEFVQALSQNFPFFKTKNPRAHPNPPTKYDPRYNDMTCTFPFDYDLVDTNKISQQQDQSLYSIGNKSDKRQSQKKTNYSDPYHKPKQPVTDYNNYNQYNQKKNQNQGVKQTLEQIKTLFESDLNTYGKNLDFLIQQNDKLQIKENQIKNQHEKLKQSSHQLVNEYSSIKNQFGKYNQKELDEKTVMEMLIFPNTKDQNIFYSDTGIKGNLDVQLFLQDAYLENNSVVYKDINQEMMKLWKDEFELKLNKIYHTGKLQIIQLLNQNERKSGSFSICLLFCSFKKSGF